MNTPIYHEGESAFLSDAQIRVLLDCDNIDESPETLRQNREKLESFWNERKLDTTLDVNTINEKLLEWRDEGCVSREPNFEEGDIEECSLWDEDEFPYFRHPDYVPFIELIQDGGRPAMPFGLFIQISNHPEPKWRTSVIGWKKLLSCPEALPFRDRGDSLFGWQWRRWQLFREWQHINRNVKTDDPNHCYEMGITYKEWLRVQEGNFKKREREEFGGKMSIPDEVELEFWNVCEAVQLSEESGKGRRDVPSDASFEDYVEAVHKRLARHGIGREAILRPSHNDQDKLATWLEYVNFEYYWYELYTSDGPKELQTAHRFLAMWARNQIPRAEEETRATEDDGPGMTEMLPTEEGTANTTASLGIHHQAPGGSIRDFAVSTHGSGPKSCERLDNTVASKPELLQIPKVFITDFGYLDSTPEQINDRPSERSATLLLKPLHRQRRSSRDRRHSKKQPSTGFIPLGTIESVGESPVEELWEGLRQSPRIAAMQARKRLPDAAPLSVTQHKAQRRKLKR